LKYIVAIDIGGTTFNTGIFSESFNQIDISDKDKIRFYDNKDEVVSAIIRQVNTIIDKNNISRDSIMGVGVAAPGPLDSKNGIILNTPNLQMFQNYKIAGDFTKKLKIDTFIENDANLFSLGEWYSQYRKNKVVMGVTLGTGLGFGLVINGELFTGGNGLAMEYGLSPFEWGICEKNACIKYIRTRAKDLYGEEISPVIIEKYFKEGDKKAIKIYSEYGNNLGIILSHVINMIDPQVITIGGGLSKGFDCFKETMFLALEKHAPSFNLNHIIVAKSELRERSTMIGASLMIKNKF
tara:strand:+ start:4387 stop:5271 length:885 start_codon:yes stop_codon:yes gene_type:complete